MRNLAPVLAGRDGTLHRPGETSVQSPDESHLRIVSISYACELRNVSRGKRLEIERGGGQYHPLSQVVPTLSKQSTGHRVTYLFINLRRMAPLKPIRPVPSNTMLAGSGTAEPVTVP